MTTWILKKGSEKKFRWGHPWVFSNELAQSPKGVAPGELVELRDYSGNFLAYGYGHPNSLIAFRTLTMTSKDSIDASFFQNRLARAKRVRKAASVAEHSHRLCFAEGDYLPGLVIDRYAIANRDNRTPSQTFVLQASTAGIDKLLPQVLEGLEAFVREEAQSDRSAVTWDQTAIVIANDSKSRAMEGLAVEPKRVHKSYDGFAPESSRIIVQPSLDGLEPVIFDVDFAGGQKTGFFLDQRLNVQLASRIAREIAAGKKTVRILDLFCYVGQWGTQLAHVITSMGAKAEVVLVDASTKALELASVNVERHGGKAQGEKRDILGEISNYENGSFDIVICDPPAFVKKKKDLPTGTQAYYKLNREAIRKTAVGGLFVSCSCSGLFTEEEFRSMLARVSTSVGDRARWVARGSHSVDHPQRPEFPQGTYLKSWMGVIE